MFSDTLMKFSGVAVFALGVFYIIALSAPGLFPLEFFYHTCLVVGFFWVFSFSLAISDIVSRLYK